MAGFRFWRYGVEYMVLKKWDARTFQGMKSNLHAFLDQRVRTMLLKNAKFHCEFLVNKGLRTITNKRQ